MSASLCQDLSAALQTVEHGCGGTEFKTQTGLLLRLVNVGLSQTQDLPGLLLGLVSKL